MPLYLMLDFFLFWTRKKYHELFVNECYQDFIVCIISFMVSVFVFLSFLSDSNAKVYADTQEMLFSLKNMLTTDTKVSESNDSNSVLSKHSGSSASNDPFVADDDEPVQENIKNNAFYANDQSSRQEGNEKIIENLADNPINNKSANRKRNKEKKERRQCTSWKIQTWWFENANEGYFAHLHQQTIFLSIVVFNI